jgi:hypothetical protein
MSKSRYLPVLETIVGLVVPLLLAGPWTLLGLARGIELLSGASKMPYPAIAHKYALEFLLFPAGGLLGLISVFVLMLFGNVLRRHRFAASLTTAGIVAGTCSAGKFLLDVGLMEIRHPDYGRVADWRPILVFALVLIPPIIVAWRRVILLWSSLVADSE